MSSKAVLAGSSDPTGDDDDGEGEEDELGYGDGESIEVDLNEYVRATRSGVLVTRTNKIICTTGFVILIISMIGYVAGLLYYDQKYYSIMQLHHFSGPKIIIFVLMFSDFIASGIGIWTCLLKTGPKMMIYTCVWLLLSSLINLCVTISLTFETNDFKVVKAECKEKREEACAEYTKVTIILWCSLFFPGLKSVVILLCRLNYPSVFNWMMGKEVYVDERLFPANVTQSTNDFVNAGNIASAYFDPPDIARIAARGSLKNTKIAEHSNSRMIFVTKDETDDKAEGVSKEILDDAPKDSYSRKSRRSTFMTL